MSADCYEYARSQYGVPAYIGVKVSLGKKQGVIVSARSQLHYVHVRFDGQKHSVPVHPAELEYRVDGVAAS